MASATRLPHSGDREEERIGDRLNEHDEMGNVGKGRRAEKKKVERFKKEMRTNWVKF